MSTAPTSARRAGRIARTARDPGSRRCLRSGRSRFATPSGRTAGACRRRRASRRRARGCRLAEVGTRRISSSRPSCGTEPKKSPIARAPATSIRSGGIVISASSVSRATRPSISTASHAAMNRLTSARSRRPGAVGRRVRSTPMRARWRVLFTAATESSSASAVSFADQPRTSRRTSTARCFGGRS